MESRRIGDSGYGDGRSARIWRQSSLHPLRPAWDSLSPPGPHAGLGLVGGGSWEAIVIQAGRLARTFGRLAAIPTSDGRSRSMPDLWDSNPDDVDRVPAEQPDPAPQRPRRPPPRGKAEG
jgi:hypothetical protein